MKKNYEKAIATFITNNTSVIVTSGDPDKLEGVYSDPYGTL